jgi:hypothetical protein
MRGAIPPLPQYVFMVWCLVKQRDNFIFLAYNELYLGNAEVKYLKVDLMKRINMQKLKCLTKTGRVANLS